jgi:glycerol-3-phosphate dehydrogenase
MAHFIGEAKDAPLASARDFSHREMLFLITNERVRCIDDLLLRRTMLGIEGRVTPALVAETAGLMAQAFDWTEDAKAEAVQNFETIMAGRHKVRAVV